MHRLPHDAVLRCIRGWQIVQRRLPELDIQQQSPHKKGQKKEKHGNRSQSKDRDDVLLMLQKRPMRHHDEYLEGLAMVQPLTMPVRMTRG